MYLSLSLSCSSLLGRWTDIPIPYSHNMGALDCAGRWRRGSLGVVPSPERKGVLDKTKLKAYAYEFACANVPHNRVHLTSHVKSRLTPVTPKPFKMFPCVVPRE